MHFEVDTYTKKDLSIFPRFKGDYSIFDLYNHTLTTGGKELLELLLDSPINDKYEIVNRISTIKFLRYSQIKFQLNKNRLELIEHYLNLDIPSLTNSPAHALLDWSANFFKKSNDYYLIRAGLACLRQHLQSLYASVRLIRSSDVPEFFLQLRLELEELAAIPEFKPFFKSGDKKFSFRDINRFDYFIRSKEKRRIKNLLHFTYFLDVYISIAKSAELSGLSFPIITDSIQPELNILGLFHPLVKHPVSNDFRLQNKQNLCFVSGANMSGKSVFMKSVGLCVYLSHVGFPVPAVALETSLFNGLYSTINSSDHIDKGYSHFYSEVKRIKETVKVIEKQRKILVICDELFHGTNAQDAYDASLLITSGFSKIKNSLFFISTHITELARELKNNEGVCFKCFTSRIEADQPFYDYKLMDGVSSDRFGLTIIQNEKIMEIIDQIILEN